jgi:hypothetical protein
MTYPGLRLCVSHHVFPRLLWISDEISRGLPQKNAKVLVDFFKKWRYIRTSIFRSSVLFDAELLPQMEVSLQMSDYALVSSGSALGIFE